MMPEKQQFDMRALILRLQKARMHLLEEKPFFALMLMHMKFAVDISAETAYTDGEKIYFGPAFVTAISDSELEFILMHEIMHCVLLHCTRHRDSYDKEAFDYACDIAVNSNILHACGGDLSAITLEEYGVSMHLAPDGTDGHLYTAEELYRMLLPVMNGYKNMLQNENDDSSDSGCDGFPAPGDGKSGKPGKPGKGSGKGNGKGKSAEKKDQSEASEEDDSEGRNGKMNRPFDDHSKWKAENSELQRELWINRLMDATDVINSMHMSGSCSSGCGDGIPPAIRRLVEEYSDPQTDWRTVLDSFIQEEITDYSFTPPDRRYSDGDFFLPDYNEKTDSVKNILFMVDTSGSIDDGMLNQAFGEIKGALDQFDGHLRGWLGFFDDHIAEPVPFESVDGLSEIKPVGGRGTDFGIIFDYVANHWKESEAPASIVILTDGYARFPEESAAGGIPVLWLICDSEVTPPWGTSVKVKAEK